MRGKFEMGKERAKVCKYGKMDQFMRVIGRMIKLMVSEGV